MKRFLLYLLLTSFWLGVVFVSLVHQDAAENVAWARQFGTHALILFDLFLIFVVSLVSLKIMDLTTSEIGLTRSKKMYARLFVGGAALGFAFEQFFNAIATSSAEGASVVVEVWRQLANFAEHGVIEEYGLIGMLTSDASGPWNHSIFPMVILGIFIVKGKQVALNRHELHTSMAFLAVLYAQQFFFSLDLKYGLVEVLLMLFTASLFVVGMFSFLLSLFRGAAIHDAQEEMKQATAINLPKKFRLILDRYMGYIENLSHYSFKMFNYHPHNRRVDEVLKAKLNSERSALTYLYYGIDVAQLTLSITLAMFALTFSMQFIFAQLGMSDGEAALFGTAGITSAPEMFVASTAGPVISILLFVGSNIVDGWFSALGQLLLIGVSSVVSGDLLDINLASAIRFLTFLSWTQGLFTWLVMWWYVRLIAGAKRVNKGAMMLLFGCLLVANLYYFGLAWLSAQALGVGAEYALNNVWFVGLSGVVNKLADLGAEKYFLYLNLFGVLGVVVYRVKRLFRV